MPFALSSQIRFLHSCFPAVLLQSVEIVCFITYTEKNQRHKLYFIEHFKRLTQDLFFPCMLRCMTCGYFCANSSSCHVIILCPCNKCLNRWQSFICLNVRACVYVCLGVLKDLKQLVHKPFSVFPSVPLATTAAWLGNCFPFFEKRPPHRVELSECKCGMLAQGPFQPTHKRSLRVCVYRGLASLIIVTDVGSLNVIKLLTICIMKSRSALVSPR